MNARARQSSIERNHLRAYHRDIQDFLLKVVNFHKMECRISRNSVLVYPPDGAPPITVYARSNDRQMATLQAWLDDLNSRPFLPGEALGLGEDQAMEVSTANLLNGLIKAAPPNDPPPVDEPVDQPEWVPWMGIKGDTPVEGFEYNGTLWRCTVCAENGVEYVRSKAKGIGGHRRMMHLDRSTLYTPEAQAKALWHKRFNVLNRRVEKALELLTGEEASDPREVVRLKAANTTLRQQNARLRERLERANQAKADAEARIALIRESLRA